MGPTTNVKNAANGNGLTGGRDINLELLEQPEWNAGAMLASLQKVAKHATDHAAEAIRWYRKDRKWNRRMARLLRGGAILFTAVAAAWPMILQLIGGDGAASRDVLARTLVAKPVLASLLLAVAALFVAYDKFFGLSRGWTRFVEAEGEILMALQTFEVEWQARLVGLAGKEPTPEQVQQALAEVKAFAAKVNQVIGDETRKWVAEFQAALAAAEETLKGAEAAAKTGNILVTVSNGDAIDAPGWTLNTDFGQTRTLTGKTAALPSVLPGDHVITLSGKAKAKDLRAESIAAVKAGQSTTLELTLS